MAIPSYVTAMRREMDICSDATKTLMRCESCRWTKCIPHTSDIVDRRKEIQALNNNLLTFTAAGISSSAGNVTVPFVRDAQGRISQITDLNGKNYVYGYDTAGNLASVTFPGVATAAGYGYFPDHLLKTEIDSRGNTSTSTYYADGRLQTVTGPSVSDALGNPTQYLAQYAYNVATNTTTTTNPDGGTVVQVNNSFGKPLSITESLTPTTTRLTSYVYNPDQTLYSETNPLGKVTTYTYDANDFQTSVKDPLGNTSSTAYNQFGQPITSKDAVYNHLPTDPSGNMTTIGYDAAFNLSVITDSVGQRLAIPQYDAQGNPLRVTDENGKNTTFTYDGHGNLSTKTDPLNQVTTYTYDAMDRVATKTDPAPQHYQTKYDYDDLGHLAKTTDILSGIFTRSVYDFNGNKTDDFDQLNRDTVYTYDALNRRTKITYPITPVATKQYTYDFRGNKLTETDESGRVTKYQYDLAGQLTSITCALGTVDAATVSYTYYADGRKKTFTDERNNVTTYNYDDAGRLTSILDAKNHTTSFGYDADNRRTSVTDANGHVTTSAYDPRGNLKIVTYPDNPQTTAAYTYDGMGHKLTVKDQANLVTTNAYFDNGQLRSVTDALPTHGVTQYTYDPNGNLQTILDAAGHQTTFGYDQFHRKTSRQLPLNMFEAYTYDAVGNLKTLKDFNLKTTTFDYDDRNRLLKKTPDSSLAQPSVAFTYFPTGTRASMVDASGTKTYTYDYRDRQKSKVTPQGTLTYTYDPHGDVATIASSNTNGASATYTYDALNLLASITDNRLVAQGAASGLTTYGYDFASNLQSYTYPNGVVTTVTVDSLDRPTVVNSTKVSALTNYTYTPGPAGNRLKVVELGGRTVDYTYDNLYRLTSEAITADPGGRNGTVAYTSYDAVGNRKVMTSTLSAVPGGNMSYDANDQVVGNAYDANGNTINDGTANTYDFENHMLTHGAVSMVYDGDGNRVAEVAGGVTTKYLVDTVNPTGLSQVVDELVSGAVTRTYAYGYQLISENQLISGSWTPSFYGYDGHGNVRFLTNTAGVVTDRYDYDAFGMPVATSGTTANNFRYSGEWSDSSIGLYLLRDRYYSQAVGRFETQDPYEGDIQRPLTLHKYVYTANNPVNFVDPTGDEALIEYVGLNLSVAKQTARTAYIIGKCIGQTFTSEAQALAR
jgi:RHS repeat-associated protein